MVNERSLRSVSMKTITEIVERKILKVGMDTTSLKDLNSQYNDAWEVINFLQDLGLITYNEVAEFQCRINARYMGCALKLTE